MMVIVLVDVQGSTVLLYDYAIRPVILYDQPQIVAPDCMRSMWEFLTSTLREALEFEKTYTNVTTNLKRLNCLPHSI